MMSFYDTPYYRQIAKVVRTDEFIGKSNVGEELVPVVNKLYWEPTDKKHKKVKNQPN